MMDDAHIISYHMYYWSTIIGNLMILISDDTRTYIYYLSYLI